MRHRRQKTKTIKNHARARGWARFGLRTSDIERVRQMIQRGEGKLVERQSNRISVHEVVYGEHKMHVVYDTLRHTIVTFLYPDGNPLDLMVPAPALEGLTFA